MNAVIESKLNRLHRIGLTVGVIGLIGCAAGFATNRHQFFISYLTGCMFWVGLSLGCLVVAMIHHLTGGRWGFVTRRFLEAGFMTLPLMLILFLPLFLGLRELYLWAQPGAVAESHALRGKAPYLSLTWFTIRSLFFFVIWLVMALRLRAWSLQQDQTSNLDPTIRMRTLSGPGIVVYAVTGTFAFVDWVMSTEPKWFSTMFAVIVLIGQVLIAFAFVTLLLAWFHQEPPFRNVAEKRHFHDLGNLLLAFVIFWTYVSFGQLLVIYSGNQPNEIDWYLHRINGGWVWIIALLALFHFFVPFFLLLFRVMSQNIRRLAVIAALVFVLHIIEVYWTIEPSFFRGVHIHWTDFAAVIGVGGVWLAVFAAMLKRHPLLPQNDPRIEYSASVLENAN